jgi:hypothetical protein
MKTKTATDMAIMMATMIMILDDRSSSDPMYIGELD